MPTSGPVIRRAWAKLSSAKLAKFLYQASTDTFPDSDDVPINFTAVNVDTGIVYCNLEDGWHQAGFDTILQSSLALGRLYVVELNVGATETYEGE